MEENMVVNYREWECHTVIGQYGNNNTAIELVSTEDGSPIATATVNTGVVYPQNWVVVREQEGSNKMALALFEAGVVGDLIEIVPTGYTKASLYVLTDEFYEMVKKKLRLDEYDVVDDDQMREVLKGMAELQNSGDAGGLPCPRCGHDKMKKDLVHNSLSRRENIYICSDCGTSEAMLDMTEQEPLSLSKWSISAILR